MEPGISWTWNEYKASIKPALYYWYKNGASKEQKTKDWVECGGYKDWNVPNSVDKNLFN